MAFVGIRRPRKGSETIASAVLAGLLSGLAGCGAGESGAQRSEMPEGASFEPAAKILVIVIDCLRADHVSSYGYERATTPAIDRIASEGIRFTSAYAQSNWTKPSVASLFTGLYVRNHGLTVGETLMLPDGTLKRGLESYPLAADIPVLAESFRQAGFRTAGFIENYQIVGTQGFGRGFEIYERIKPAAAAMRNWLRDLDRSSPVFAFLHMIGPHDPYYESWQAGMEAYRSRFPDHGSTVDFEELAYKKRGDLEDRDVLQAISFYDSEVAYHDEQQVEMLVRWLEEEGLYDDFLIVVTADHGEELFDHQGWAHGHSLFEEVIRVPLIFKLPRHLLDTAPPPGSVLGETVELIDLFPTLLELAAVEPPEAMDGRSLAPLVLGFRQPDPDAFAITEFGRDLPGTVLAAAIVHADRKLVVRYSVEHAPQLAGFARYENGYQVFELKGASESRLHTRQNWVWGLRQRLVDTVGHSPVIRRSLPERVPLTPLEVENLRALGYLED